MDTDTPGYMLSYALGYAKRQLKVFPCYETFGSVCTCGNPDCTNEGKHPRNAHGVNEATTDPQKIQQWWKQWPNSNIGLSAENMIVIDIDAKKQGYASLERLETELGKLPETREAITGGGGSHYFFRRNGCSVKNCTNLRLGVDIRTNGGYVIAAPSTHKSGKRYKWVANTTKTLSDLTPEWVKFIENSNTKSNGEKPRFDTAGAIAGVPEGQRDTVCWQLACKLRNADVPYEIAVSLVDEAASNCTPPFSSEIAREKVLRAYKIYQPKQAEPGSAGVYRNVASEVRDYVETLTGSFSTQQLYIDLGIKEVQDKVAARVALCRMKGSILESDGGKAGWYRVISDHVVEMDLDNVCTEELDLWLPFHLHNYTSTMPGNQIVIAGGPDAGKTAALFNIVKNNIEKWSIYYWNSEMSPEEFKARLDLFSDFPRKHKNFHPFERSHDFQDVIKPGKYVLNIIDFLELTEEFYKVSKLMSDIHHKLDGAVAVVAMQTKTGTNLPLGGERAYEKARLAISLRSGNRNDPNVATIQKCKNRKTEHSMIGRTRTYKLIKGSEFRYITPDWS
jgi:hypothetical protein